MKQKKASFIYLLAVIGAAFIWGFLTIPLKRLHHLGYFSHCKDQLQAKLV